MPITKGNVDKIFWKNKISMKKINIHFNSNAFITSCSRNGNDIDEKYYCKYK